MPRILSVAQGSLRAFLGMTFYLLSPLYPADAEKVSGGNFAFTVEIAPFREGEKEKYNLSPIVHPYAFDSKTIQSSMAALGYQERTLAWSEAKRVFGNSVIRNLAPMIAETFARVGSDQRVVFKISAKSGTTLTEGDVFLTFQGLHWRFTAINKSKRKIDDFSIMGETWRLVERDGQKYREKIRADLNNLSQNITNWVVLPKVRPEASRILRTSPPPHSPAPAAGDGKTMRETDGSDIRKKFRILEELKKENLIDEEEYKRKREELLRSF
jgi:hypothetical protein